MWVFWAVLEFVVECGHVAYGEGTRFVVQSISVNAYIYSIYIFVDLISVFLYNVLGVRREHYTKDLNIL
jgi:hypothetical protein